MAWHQHCLFLWLSTLRTGAFGLQPHPPWNLQGSARCQISVSYSLLSFLKMKYYTGFPLSEPQTLRSTAMAQNLSVECSGLAVGLQDCCACFLRNNQTAQSLSAMQTPRNSSRPFCSSSCLSLFVLKWLSGLSLKPVTRSCAAGLKHPCFTATRGPSRPTLDFSSSAMWYQPLSWFLLMVLYTI